MADQAIPHSSSTGSPSSGGVESHHCTPATKVTDFSPEDTRHQMKPALNGGIQISSPPAFSLHGVPIKVSPNGKAYNPHVTLDPFTATSSTLKVSGNATSGIKLSPTAASFNPMHSGTVAPPTKRSELAGGGVALPTSGPVYGSTSSAVSYLNATSVPDYGPSQLKPAQNCSSVPSSSALSPIGPPVAAHSASSSSIGRQSLALSVTDTTDTSRYLKIFMSRDTTTELLRSTFANLSSSVPKLIVISDLASEGIVYVQFSDLRDAEQAYQTLGRTQSGWVMQFVGVKQFVANHKPEHLDATSEFESQVKVNVLYDTNGSPLELGQILILVRNMLEHYGDLLSYNVSDVSFPTLSIIAGYYDVDAANKAVNQLHAVNVQHMSLTISWYTPDLNDRLESSTTKNRGPLIMGGGDYDLDHNFGNLSISGNVGRLSNQVNESRDTWSSLGHYSSGSSGVFADQFRGYPASTSSATMYTPHAYGQNQRSYPAYGYPPFGGLSLDWQTRPQGAFGQIGMVSPAPRARISTLAQRQHGLNKGSLRQSNEYGSGHHNVVDVERIREGLDVRTTIMLRNIPNKVDQALLKEIVDETSRGKYDFMYLRIDFANQCNVGYAFINFEDPYYIIDFVRARAGHRWNRFNSDKVAEVSYATIQGKDCLVQKFRNSSVMLETPKSRPKIFYTGKDFRAGQEEKFPGPDNPSKMRRSVENAEHVGLFAPRAGQHFRDEQRRRRSQYDRGTRLAELEDSYEYDDYPYQELLAQQYLVPDRRSYHGSQGAFPQGY